MPIGSRPVRLAYGAIGTAMRLDWSSRGLHPSYADALTRRIPCNFAARHGNGAAHAEVQVKKLTSVCTITMAAMLLLGANAVMAQDQTTTQQSNVPPAVRQAEDEVERVLRRAGFGVTGGVGVDPELIMFGAHGRFGPFFTPGLHFRPGVDFGVGEVTTTFAINLDVLYALPGASRTARWVPYVGAGPNFALSHLEFRADGTDENGNRFDFSDTDFDGGFNFIAGAQHRNGMFLEMKATAYGVSNVRLLVGYNF